jgi:ATP-grasp domain
VPSIWYRGRSPFLFAACFAAFPHVRFSRVGESAPSTSPGDDAVAVAFFPDAETTAWANDVGVRLLLPPRRLAEAAADKIGLIDVARAAGVSTPRCRVVLRHDFVDIDRCRRLIDDLGSDNVVAQLPMDNTTGAGTRFVHGAAELHRCLEAWRGRDIRVSVQVSGTPLTISGCVLPHQVVVSGLSHQLVGYPALTAIKGAHCGNQLLADEDLPAGASEECLRAGQALGEQLRRIGFRGMFGVDCLLSGDNLLAIEINPRIQSVSSLLGFAELRSGLLPMPLTHVFGYLHADVVSLETGGPVPPFSQVVIYAPASSTTLPEMIPEGRCRLCEDGSIVALSSSTPGELSDPALTEDLGPDEAVVWPFAAEGEIVPAGGKLAVVQFGGRVAELGDGHRLSPSAQAWADALGARRGALV